MEDAMNPSEFFAAVESDSDLQGVAITERDGRVTLVVLHKPSGYVTALPVESIEACQWSDLRGVITGERPPNVLYQMARIVGYYSRIENWNKSKLGELRDRHKGNYTPDESSKSADTIQQNISSP